MARMHFVSFVCLVFSTERVISQTATTPANVYVPGVCICVTSGYCDLASGQGTSDGVGIIDPRIMTNGPPSSPITGNNNMTMTPQSSGIMPVVVSKTSCAAGLDLCCPSYYSCGISYPPVTNAPQPMTGQGQVPYGSFPWHVAVLSPSNYFYGSGVLIDHMNVLTAAHKLNSASLPFKVRLGEWDASGQTTEPFPSIEIEVASVTMHPQYNSRTLQYDLAILTLSSNVPLGLYPTITNICLPTAPLSNMRCWVSGWGKNSFANSGSYQAIMKAIDVPLVDYNTCKANLQATRLGRSFVLDNNSFVCAGGEAGNDACTGDGGSPLVCNIDQTWFLAGIVSWGIGCGTANVPGVYVNTLSLTPWIKSVIGSVGAALKTTMKPQSNSVGSTTLSTKSASPTTSTKIVSNSTTATQTTKNSTSATTTIKTGNALNTTTLSTKGSSTSTSKTTSTQPKTTLSTTKSSAQTTTSKAGNALANTTAIPATTRNVTSNVTTATTVNYTVDARIAIKSTYLTNLVTTSTTSGSVGRKNDENSTGRKN